MKRQPDIRASSDCVAREYFGAAASFDFFLRFEDPDDLHYNILSPAERRLIAEWLDVGAQYYNNPFDAPAN